MTVNEALKWAEERMTVFKVPDARAEAEFLLTHLLACKRHELFLNSRRILSDAEEEVFLGYVERKANREPSQYIVGEAEFFGLGFKVTKDTLIPRPETELLVEEALSASKAFSADGKLTVIDLCTGSGCVAITVATELPECMVYATDISNGALAIARENAIRNNVDSRVNFLEGDLFGPLEGKGLEGKAQMVLSNPPYVPLTEREK
ncbi:MAG: peptide chain release factor N(5)-glutamine methyltransferase, partial [Deltaproteobacteria bacterium]|nr:peptide chain release factor N(5)-glutamine methyltransferase [Deltaproteobacteria bacterium]